MATHLDLKLDTMYDRRFASNFNPKDIVRAFENDFNTINITDEELRSLEEFFKGLWVWRSCILGERNL